MRFFNSILLFLFLFFISCQNSYEKFDFVHSDGDVVHLSDSDDAANDADEERAEDDESEIADSNDEIPEEACAAAGGSWNGETATCTKTVSCGEKPANTKWNGEDEYVQTLAEGGWTPENSTVYDENRGTCKYICDDNFLWDGEKCNPAYCYAQFNGESSFIEVLHNDLLNLSEEWTIEAWIKQTATENKAPIIRKGDSQPPSYMLYAFQNNGSNFTMQGFYYYDSEKARNIEYSVDEIAEGEWSHVALVKLNQYPNTSKGYIFLFYNGNYAKGIRTKMEEPAFPNDLSLFIGKNPYVTASNPASYFNGMIDSIRISNRAKYEFLGEDETFDVPRELAVEADTIALWQFNGNANDDSPNGLNGIETDIVYVQCE